jgi:heme-degrading monooxygenase HmoA
MPEDTTPVTVINKFEVPTQKADRFVSEWQSDKDFFRGQPGFLGGSLYCNLAPKGQFLFINVAP